MAYPVSNAYLTALTSRFREVNVRAKIVDKNGGVRLGYDDINIDGGEVVVDWTDHLGQPARTLNLSCIDPDRLMDFSLVEGDHGRVWFSCRVRVEYGVRVANGTFEYCPVFTGWIEQLERAGEETVIHAGGKEVRHLSPYLLDRSYQVDKSTKFSDALFDFFRARGTVEDLLDIPVRPNDDRAKHNLHYALGMEPWKIGQNWANHLDKQLFYRGDGDLKLRNFPTDPAWEFVKGDTSIVLEWPALRMSTEDFFNEAFILTEKIRNDGPLKAERPEPVIGYAELKPGDALAASTLSEHGTKPLVRIWERPEVQTFKRANQIAANKLAAAESGIEADLGITILPLPHLEEMDVLKVKFGTYGLDEHRFRAKRFTLPLTPEGEMVINWAGRKVPAGRKGHIRTKRRRRGKRS